MKTLVEDLGGTLESFYVALGDADACIVELPGVTADELLTAAQMDEAATMKATYRAPAV